MLLAGILATSTTPENARYGKRPGTADLLDLGINVPGVVAS